MLDFELFKDEKINIISNDSLLEYRNEVEQVSVVITNHRFIIFCLPKDIESFRFGKMIDNFKINKMDIIFETELSNIDKIIIGNDFDKYILKDTNYFYLHDDIIRNYLKDNNIVEEK